METDYLKAIWQIMDKEKAASVFIDIEDEKGQPFKGIILLSGAETVAKFKEFHDRQKVENV